MISALVREQAGAEGALDSEEQSPLTSIEKMAACTVISVPVGHRICRNWSLQKTPVVSVPDCGSVGLDVTGIVAAVVVVVTTVVVVIVVVVVGGGSTISVLPPSRDFIASLIQLRKL